MSKTRLLLAALLAIMGTQSAGGCAAVPGADMDYRIGALPEDVRKPVRDAIWAAGNPFVWAEQKTVVIETTWFSVNGNVRSPATAKTYTLDLTSRRLRIDDPGQQRVALFDGQNWRIVTGQTEVRGPIGNRIAKPAELMALETAAGEMRTMRLMFAMPFSLLDEGVRLQGLGNIKSRGGVNNWNVVRVTFDPTRTGFLAHDPSLRDQYAGDSLLVYFDPTSGLVDRMLTVLADPPFNGVPHWAEWSEYRQEPNQLKLARRWDFRTTDPAGAADLSRRLTVRLERVTFNAELPRNVFSNPAAKPVLKPATGETQPGNEPVIKK